MLRPAAHPAPHGSGHLGWEDQLDIVQVIEHKSMSGRIYSTEHSRIGGQSRQGVHFRLRASL